MCWKSSEGGTDDEFDHPRRPPGMNTAEGPPVEGGPEVLETPARLPTTLLVVIVVTVVVVTASALLGPVSAPEFFMTYALIQAAVFLVLIYMADFYQHEPITVVGLMVVWGGTVACLLAVPGNEFVNGLLPEKIRLVFGPAIAAPLVEEAAKGTALVLAFALSQVAARRLGAHAFEGFSDGLVYGAAVGMGFAFTEDVFYFYGLAHQAGIQEGWELFQSRVDLFGLNMLGHSIYTGLFGAGLGAATVITRRWRRVLAGGAGFAAAIAAHSIHNGLTNAVLAARFGLDVASAALANRLAPTADLTGALDATASTAQVVSRVIDFLLVVGVFLGVALWLRHQQRILAQELVDEDAEVASPEEVHLVVHYLERLLAYGRLLRHGKVEEWRLSRVVHAELTALAFLKWRARTGRADAAQVDRQRYLVSWSQAALRANRTKPDRGSKELLALSDEALRSSRYDLAESLLEVRAELVAPDDLTRGRMAVIAGRQLAESAFRYEEAFEEYRKAVAAFDRALARDPANADAHMHRAGALFRLGEAQADLSRPEEAVGNYREAVAAADAALALEPGLAEAHRNRAAALMRLGEAEAQRSRHEDARAAYLEAIAAVEAALALTPDDARAHNIKGIAFLGLGEADTALGLVSEAAESFRAAGAACREAARLVPDFAYALLNSAVACTRAGELEAGQDRVGDAEESFRQAVVAFDEALRVAPDYVKALAGRAGALTRLARLQCTQGQFDEAAETARSALAGTDRALELARGHVRAHVYRAEAFLLISDLEARQGRRQASADAARRAVDACDDALCLAPGDGAARSLRADARLSLDHGAEAQANAE